jgi:hypothetical protein
MKFVLEPFCLKARLSQSIRHVTVTTAASIQHFASKFSIVLGESCKVKALIHPPPTLHDLSLAVGRRLHFTLVPI